ncbi:hypothetical protein [Pseudokineococcus sp. 1T1Z-3]|uniref:hypothetical protein n=1 Tax=Pseudokineococcus sp. 1T1Z-3 TaxID=3132745 RepID=UPI0030A8C702
MPETDLRAAPPVRSARRRAVAGWVALALLAAVGLAAVGLGVAQRTVWLPDDEVSATATTTTGGDAPARLVVTAPGVLETRPGPVTVTATSPDGGPVVLVLGREVDVQAWTADVPTAVVGGLTSETTLGVDPPAAAAAQVDLTDVAGSDLWTRVETGEGTATMQLDVPEGRWLVLAAADGEGAAPEEITLTWPQEVVTPYATPLLVGGGTALLLALALAVVHARTSRTRRHRALEQARDEAPGPASGPQEPTSPDARDDTRPTRAVEESR